MPAASEQGCDTTGGGVWQDVYSGGLTVDATGGWHAADVPVHKGRCFRLYMESSVHKLSGDSFTTAGILQLKTGALWAWADAGKIKVK